jgi:hypothetical protein
MADDTSTKIEVFSGPKPGSIDFAVSQLLGRSEKDTSTEEPETALVGDEGLDDLDPTEYEVQDDESEHSDISEEGEEESDPDTEEQEGDLYFTVKVDGEEYEVTADELKSGYQRQKDYTKKTQALSDQRKQYEAKEAELTAQQEKILHQSYLANKLLERDLEKFSKVDWDHLKQNDPIQFVQKQIELQDVRGQQAQLQAEAQSVYEFNQKAKAEAQAQQLEVERKHMLQLFPEWKNDEKAAIAQKKIVEYGRKLGFLDEELASITSAKALLVMDKARKYDALEAEKKGIKDKTTPPIRKVLKPKGSPVKGSVQRKAIADGRDRLKQTGSLRDAAALMHQMRTSNKILK